MNKCKNCQFFDNKQYPDNPTPERGICGLYAFDELQKNHSFIHPFYSDEEQDFIEFTVGENFGCIHFKLRKVDPQTGIILNNN